MNKWKNTRAAQCLENRVHEDIGYISGKKWPFVEIKVSLDLSQHKNVIFEGFAHFHALLHTLAQFQHNFHANCDIFDLVAKYFKMYSGTIFYPKNYNSVSTA